jgi:ammonia channel protein AmtB
MTDTSTAQWEKAVDLGRQIRTNCFRQWEQKVPRPLIGLFIALLGNVFSDRSSVEGYMEERDLDQDYLFSPHISWFYRIGSVAGLVCITPASGYVQPMPALAMGIAAGIVCFLACTKLKSAFGYDDSLDAFGVHGVGGTLGAVLTGIFATRDVADPVLVSKGQPVGLVDGNVRLLVGQIVAAATTWVLAAVASFVILKVLDLTLGLRVRRDDEIQGLDLSQHGEEGYIFL